MVSANASRGTRYPPPRISPVNAVISWLHWSSDRTSISAGPWTGIQRDLQRLAYVTGPGGPLKLPLVPLRGNIVESFHL
jgi:hypothetical protein